MAHSWRRLASELLADVRINLDEATATFWTDNQLYRFLTQAADSVCAEVRKVKADYHVQSLQSTQGTVTIYGDSYACSSFQIVPSTTEYTLPGNLQELKLIECITSGYETVAFTYRDLSSPEFRALRSLVGNQSPTAFYFDIVGENTLTIAPRSDTTLDLQIWYVGSNCITSTAGASKAAFTVGTDELILPHPLYIAVEEVATWRAQLMDENPSSGSWATQSAASVARWMGGHARQIQDPEFVSGTFE